MAGVHQLPPPNLPQGTSFQNTDQLINDYFYEIDAGGGGNCLFRSLSYLLSDIPNNHDLIRLQICTYDLPEEVKDFIDQDERKAMCLDGTWGTDLEIQIASIISKKPIIVYKKDHLTGISGICSASSHIPRIVSGEIFTGVRKYLVEQPYSLINRRIYCIYLPVEDTADEPLILYNLDQNHYRALKPQFHIVAYGMNTKRKTKSIRKSSKRKTKSIKRNKSIRKSSKTTKRKSSSKRKM